MSQKRAPDLIIDDCKPPCDCWELNSGLLEEQSVLSTSEPFLQPKNLEYFLKLFIYYIYIHCSCLQKHQKRAPDLIMDGCEPPCGCWDLNSRPSEEQSVLLTAEPSLQSREFSNFLVEALSAMLLLLALLSLCPINLFMLCLHFH